MQLFNFSLLSLWLQLQITTSWAEQVPIIGDPSAPTVYLIRHGEKPPKNAAGEDPPGLSADGLTRAEALVDVFGTKSSYNISYILAEHPQKNGDRTRPLKTVEPLAEHLGLKVHTKIKRDDPQGVAIAVRKYKGTGNILICWEHSQLTNISLALGATQYSENSSWAGIPVLYPHKRFDLIWEVPHPYTHIAKVKSEGVPGLDDGKSSDPPGNSADRSHTASLLLWSVVVFSIVYSFVMGT